MYCTRCGTKNARTAKFCRECGRKLGAETPQLAAVVEEPTVAQPVDMVSVGDLLFQAFQSFEAGKVDDAENLCKEALQMHPDSSSGHSLLAMIFEAKGDLRAAVRHLERVLALNPKSIADREKLQELRTRMKSLLGAAPTKKSLVDYLNEDLDGMRRFLAAKRPWPEAIGATAAAFLLMFFLWPHIRPAETTAPQPQVKAPSAGQMSANAPGMQPVAPPVFPSGGAPQFIGPAPTPAGQSPAAPTLPTPRWRAPRPAVRPPEPRYGSFPSVTIEPRPKYGPLPASPATPAPAGTNLGGSMKIERSDAPAPRDQSPAERARQLQMAGEYEAAITAWQQALSAGRNTGQIHQQIATCYQRIGRHKDAITNYQNAIKSYQQDIAAGRNTEDARRGIKSSELGVTVSQREGG